MENKCKISLIVPFYGVERYIGQCLESIYRQDLPESEYEVICNNDCSPDNSEQIVMQYAKAHPNLHLIRHEVNKKLGAARNTGLKAAKGDYVWFIDSDDFIQANCLREIVKTCAEHQLDMLHWSIINNRGEVSFVVNPTVVISGIDEEIDSKRHKHMEVTFPWNRVYRREFLLENNLLFNDLYGGDVIHTILAVNSAQRVMNVDKYYYIYRVDNYNSDTHSANTAWKTYNMNFVLSKAIDDILPDIDIRWRDIVTEGPMWRVNHCWKGILKLPVSEQLLLRKYLRENEEIKSFVLTLANKRTTFVIKHPYLTMMLSPIYKLFKIVRDLIKK